VSAAATLPRLARPHGRACPAQSGQEVRNREDDGVAHDRLRSVKPIAPDRADVKPQTLDTVTSWTPAVVATLLGLPVVAISALKLLVIVVVLSSPDMLIPSEPSVTNILPSDWVIAPGIAELVLLVLAAVGLIGSSWLYVKRERAKASWVCALAVGLLLASWRFDLVV